ncbi:MAG: MarR family transcriptional regulator [Sporolactobacillus sp.]
MKTNTGEIPSEKKIKISNQLWKMLSRAYHLQAKSYNQFLKEWGLSLSQYHILSQIGSHERISQKELAERLFVSKGNVTQLISKMEKSGLIHREQEWKTKYLTLTEQGLALFREIEPQQKLFLFRQFQEMPKKEQKEMTRLLDAFICLQTANDPAEVGATEEKDSEKN